MSSVSNSEDCSAVYFSAQGCLGNSEKTVKYDDAQGAVRTLAVCLLVKAVPVEQEAVL